MPEQTSEPNHADANETAKESTPVTEPSAEQADNAASCTKSRCCSPHTSIVISIIALLLAGYAAFTAAKGHDNTAIEARLGNMDNQIAGINDQIISLDEAVKSNRENLIQTKLKKALQNIQDIGDLAGEKTKETISEVETMLKTLTSISEQLDTPAASIEPASEPALEPATSPESTPPAEIIQPEPTPSESTQAEPAAAPEQPSAVEPTPTAPDTSATKPAPAKTKTTPAQPADTSSVAPTDSQAATGTPPADVTPAAEPSAPQAF